MRRRLLLAPFTVRIPADERDPELAEKLWGERAAILRWCLDGCLQWQRDGLAPPACVRDATDEYFRGQDTIGEWLEDCTEDADDRAFDLYPKPLVIWGGTWEFTTQQIRSVTELARVLRQPAPTVHRLLCVLKRRGFVRQDEETLRYSLTLKMLDV